MASTTIDPDFYIANNSGQRASTLRALDLLQSSFMEEAKDQQFLDLGCGTGDFTRDHLLPRCPNVGKMVAVDVSADMVEYAKKHFAHPKICYDVLDISTNDVTDFVQRYGQFDRVYSFFCLHWVRDQEAAFKNIAELMKPGGGCLLLFMASNTSMQLPKRLATLDHWQKYRKILEDTISPSADLEDRDAFVSYIRGLLKSANLIPATCEVLQVKRTWSSFEEFTKMHIAFNRWLSSLVTEEEKSRLVSDIGELAADVWSEKEAGGSLFTSTRFLVRAQKPQAQHGN